MVMDLTNLKVMIYVDWHSWPRHSVCRRFVVLVFESLLRQRLAWLDLVVILVALQRPRVRWSKMEASGVFLLVALIISATRDVSRGHLSHVASRR